MSFNAKFNDEKFVDYSSSNIILTLKNRYFLKTSIYKIACFFLFNLLNKLSSPIKHWIKFLFFYQHKIMVLSLVSFVAYKLFN